MKMKYISTLLVIVALFAVNSSNAQTASKLNGQSYTYVMKDINGVGPEIIDQFSFGVGKVTSSELGRTGFDSGKVIEKNSGASSDFELTFSNKTAGTRVYKGKAEGVTIDGTIDVTDSNGKKSVMAFRGMLTEEWNNIQNERNGVSTPRSAEEKKKMELQNSQPK
jgi:hypothetical protein